MGVNKVALSTGETLIDLSNDKVTPATLALGVTAHNAKGELIVGEMQQQSGSGGGTGSGIIDVTELPTSGIDENAVYRVTESYKASATDIYCVIADEETGEIMVAPLSELTGLQFELHIVDSVEDMLPSVDVPIFNILQPDGIAYLYVPEELDEPLPIGILLFEMDNFDKGYSDDIYAETEFGVYTTLEAFKEVVRYFIRENGEWREISAHIDEYFPNGTQDITVLSGEYTKGEEIVVTQNGTTIDIVDKIINDKSIPTVVVDTPSVADLLRGSATNYNNLTITDDYFRDKNGDYIYKIRAGAFYECYIDDIVVPETVVEIGERAFTNCSAYTISLPDSVRSISHYTFARSQFESLRLPEQLKEIGECAFEYSNFNQQLPNSVERIADYAFRRCNSLQHISLPKSLSYIGGWAFDSCYSLKTVTFNSKPEFYFNNFIFGFCNSLTTINVPWSEGEVAGAPWGAPNATINYNYTEG